MFMNMTTLVVEGVTQNGGAFKSGGIWYNLPRGTTCPPLGTQVNAQVVQSLNNKGLPKYTLANMQVVGGYVPQPTVTTNQPAIYVPQPALQAAPAPMQSSEPKAYKPYVNDRGSHDTTAEQKLRYNALSLAVDMVTDGNLDAVLAIGAELYAVIKDGFTEQKVPVQQVAVQAPKARKAQPAVQLQAQQAAAQYSAFEQPEFEDDDLPFAQ